MAFLSANDARTDAGIPGQRIAAETSTSGAQKYLEALAARVNRIDESLLRNNTICVPDEYDDAAKPYEVWLDEVNQDPDFRAKRAAALIKNADEIRDGAARIEEMFSEAVADTNELPSHLGSHWLARLGNLQDDHVEYATEVANYEEDVASALYSEAAWTPLNFWEGLRFTDLSREHHKQIADAQRDWIALIRKLGKARAPMGSAPVNTPTENGQLDELDSGRGEIIENVGAVIEKIDGSDVPNKRQMDELQKLRAFIDEASGRKTRKMLGFLFDDGALPKRQVRDTMKAAGYKLVSVRSRPAFEKLVQRTVASLAQKDMPWSIKFSGETISLFRL